MPSVSRQKPTGNVGNGTTSVTPSMPRPAAGSLLSGMIPVSELISAWMKVCIYGENRSGKTTLACKFPKPLALIALEMNETGGAASVTREPGVMYRRLTSRLQAIQMAEELSRDTYFQSVVVDGATSLQDIILTELLRDATGQLIIPPEMLTFGMVSEDQYRQRSEQVRETLRPFLNLKKHVVVIAKQRDHRPKDRNDKRPKIIRGFQPESFFSADVGGATAGWLADACDILLQLYVERETKEVRCAGGVVAGKQQADIVREEETGRQVRRLRTMYDVNYAAGIRSCSPAVVPLYIQGDTPDQMYEDLVRVIRGERAKGGKYLNA